jgi:hypothetical protein
MSRVLLLAALSLSPCVSLAQTQPADVRGIYVYTNDVSALSKPGAANLTQAINVPGVDGVAVVIGWQAIEPAMGQYQWATLDQWLTQVIASGKKIDLVIPAGSSIPAWLFQPAPSGAGAADLNFTVSPHAGETGVCDTVDIPAPWDAAFLAQWDSMLSALSAHLKSTGAYNSITLLRLTGINRTTEELRLPAETAASTGLACVSNSIATWQAAGYRPSLLLQGWNAVVGSFNKYFPDKSFSVAIIPNDAFPGIDQNGNAIVGTIGDENEPLLQSASQLLPGRLVVQFDFLMPGVQPSVVVTNAAQNYGTMVAWQTNEYLGTQGAGCSEPITSTIPCTSDLYLQLLETGVYPLGQANPLRAQYIEVFNANANANALQQDILTAHFQLLPPSVTLVANAEGGVPVIAPNTWVEILGSGLSLTGDSRAWTASDFINSQLPVQLDNIGVSVNGKPAFVYYLSPAQINILTPPDGSLALVFRVQRWTIRRRDSRRRIFARSVHFVSRIHHPGEAWRNRGDLRQRFWRHLDARRQRIRAPIGESIAVTGDPYRRRRCRRPVCRFEIARPVPIQRDHTRRRNRRRSTHHCRVPGAIHTSQHADHYSRLNQTIAPE